jgi:hypothetical protein
MRTRRDERGDVTGRCQCGAVRYRADGPVRNACFCHCASCRRAAGASPVAWATIGSDRFRITTGDVREYSSSPNVVRGFCERCGATLTYRHAARVGEIDFTLATLDDPDALRPMVHIWVQDKLPWISIDDGLPQFRTVVGAAQAWRLPVTGAARYRRRRSGGRSRSTRSQRSR